MYSIDSTFLLHSTNRWLAPSAHWMLDQMLLFKDLQSQQVVFDSKIDPVPDYPISKKQKQLILGSRTINLQDWRRNLLVNSKAKHKILFSHFGPRGYYDLAYSALADKHIVRFYGYDVHRLVYEKSSWKEKYAELFSKVHEVWVEGNFMMKSLEKMGCPPSKLKVLPIGVDTVKNETKPRKNGKLVKILIGGTFKEKKGIDTALRTLQKVQTKNKLMPFEVHFIGQSLNATNNDIAYARSIEAILKECSFPIIKHGFVSRTKLREIASGCHFGLFPSQWAKDRDCEGGYPILFLECMAQALPVVSTNHCDIPTIVNSKNGEICNERDTEALAKAVLSMFDEESRTIKAYNAKQTVINDFQWDKLKQRYIKQLLS